MSKKRVLKRWCLFCGDALADDRSKKCKFCNASHRLLYWRRSRIAEDRMAMAAGKIDRVAELLAYDSTNSKATHALKLLAVIIDTYLENGYQRELPGVSDEH